MKILSALFVKVSALAVPLKVSESSEEPPPESLPPLPSVPSIVKATFAPPLTKIESSPTLIIKSLPLLVVV